MDTSDPVSATLTQWQLIRRRFSRHKLALASLHILILLYTVVVFCEFFAPTTREWRDVNYAYCSPQAVKFSFRRGFYTHAMRLHRDPITYKRHYVEETDQIIPLGFLVRGEPYRLWGLFPCSRHLFGIDYDKLREQHGATPSTEAKGEGHTNIIPTFYLLGADRFGHDLLSRIIYGSRISLSVGLIAIAISFALGLTIGGIAGYAGGVIDNVIMRFREILNSFPGLPLWLALSAAMPSDWSVLKTYFGITLVLSLKGWTGLARVVRGKLLSMREEDYAVAARLLGASQWRIIFRHLLPGFTSHIIVSLTMSVPGMIIGETGLSFLGLGLRPPVVSWGVLLRDCMNMETVENYPWLLLPALFILVTVLAFNFVGDGLRDAADPYSG